MRENKNKINSTNLPRIIGCTLTVLIVVILLLYFVVDNKVQEINDTIPDSRVNEQEVFTHYDPIVGYDNEYFYFAESYPYFDVSGKSIE